MFRFADPQYLNLIWGIPILGFFMFAFEKRAQMRLAKAYGAKVTGFLTGTVSASKRRLKVILKLLSLTFLALALARPQAGQGSQSIKSEGVELMILFDVSTSMLAEDVKPSRLASAKAEVNRLADLLSGDKIGLIAFAGSAILLSPLTSDKAAFKMYVEGLSPKTVENQGTEFRKALVEAEKAFERGGVDPDEGVKLTKVILIASDGEDQEPGAREAAQKLASKGIKIFTLAFGSEHGAPIPVRDEYGNLTGHKKDHSGQEVVTKVDDSVLRDLAQAGGGSFYHSSNGGNEAKLIRDDIDKLEKATFDTKIAMSYEERYQIFLFIGLALAFIDLLISGRRREGKFWRGRFELRTGG